MRQTFTTIIGKSVRKLAQVRGGGSALPGLFVEKIDPNFMKRALSTLPQGVVLISGTNGKTTTTKIVVELLESQGLTVFTNRTGSNFTRGVVAALLGEVDRHGVLDADIAVLELDEAYAVRFANLVQPRYCLLLNVMRDQLDRFGEIDKTAALLQAIATKTTEGVVINRDDPRLSNPHFAKTITAHVTAFGVSPQLRALFPSDDAMRMSTVPDETYHARLETTLLESIEDTSATLRFGGKNYTTTLKLKGVYNTQNATGAVALVRQIMGNNLNTKKLFAELECITPAFGRGETITVNGDPCELVLVKNPSGFRLSLKSFDPRHYATMIAINDAYADGRDMSWLWDVDFNSLRETGVTAVSGIRCYDMALRLQYDEIEMTHVEPTLHTALNQFFDATHGTPKRIYCTYTAMLAIRKDIAKRAKVEVIR